MRRKKFKDYMSDGMIAKSVILLLYFFSRSYYKRWVLVLIITRNGWSIGRLMIHQLNAGVSLSLFQIKIYYKCNVVICPPEADKICLEYRRICILDAIDSPVSERRTNFITHNLSWLANVISIFNDILSLKFINTFIYFQTFIITKTNVLSILLSDFGI